MAYDPVLDRQMFQSRDTKGRGITAADTSDDTTSADLKARREQAAAMLEASKKKFDPSNFQTLSEQERPEVFRPVAVNMPAQQQTANTAQQMQQMAAQGVQQPVQMAIGGLAAFARGGQPVYGYAGGKVVTEDGPMTPTVDDFNTLGARFKKIKSDVQGIGSLKEPTEDKIEPTVTAPSAPSSSELPKGDISTWSDSDIENVADDIVSRGTQGRTPFARGIQSLLGTKAPDRSAVVERLRNERDQEIQANANKPASIIPSDRDAELAKAQGDFAKRQEAVGKAIEANPVKSIFEEQTPEERNTAIAIQNAAASNAAEKAMNPPTISEAQTAGGSGDYMTNAPSGGIASLPPTISEAQTAGGSGEYMTNAPSGIATVPSPDFTAQTAGGSGDYMSNVPSAPSAPSAPGQTLNARSPGTEAGGPASDATMKALNAYNTAKTDTTGGAGGTGAAKMGETDTTGGLTMEDIKARRNQERQDNFNMALMQAGLAIAGGKSSNALTNIGEGGVTGVQAFAKGEQESRVLERERMADLRQQQQLQLDAAYKKASLANAAAQLGISQQDVALRRDSLQQSLNEFNQNIDLKKQEFTNNIQVAIANRDAKMAENLTSSLTTQINAVQAARSRIASNVQMSIMSPDAAKLEENRLAAQENGLRQQADYLRTQMAKSAGINLPSVAAAGLPAEDNVSDPLGIRKK